MDPGDHNEKFYGVYMLKSLNPKYKGRTYIGFTVDPNRRIRQHNRGKKYGGAWKTSKRGPWEMILVVHGFPSDIAALRFEWAWQHPKRSRRLKAIINNKKTCESSIDYNIRIMFTMLSIPPWKRLPLTICWLSADMVVDAPPNLAPPTHMAISYGRVIPKKVKETAEYGRDQLKLSNGCSADCQLCTWSITEKDLLICVNENCNASWHIFCLAKKFLEEELMFSSNRQKAEVETRRIVPVEGSCPKCKSLILWGDLIKKKKWLLQKCQISE